MTSSLIHGEAGSEELNPWLGAFRSIALRLALQAACS